MGTSVQLTPLSGAHSEAPLCYLLDVDGFRFLLDCGWDDRFDIAALEPLVSICPTIDAVLLSHPDTLHLGALPYAVKNLGLGAIIYCTLPVNRMGLMYMYDHYLSRRAVSNFDLFNLDDVDMAFQNSVQMTYSQHLPLTGKGEGIVITPYTSGHLLGGTMWKITKDTEDIIYAVDFNHRKERHLNGTVLESFVRPAVLITDAYNALNNQPVRRQRDQEFVDAIITVLRAGGNVLLPVETAGRVLELILYLEQYWSLQRLSYSMAFLTNVSISTVEFAKSLLEWMSDAIAKSFEHNRDNAFQLKSIKLFHTRKELDELPEGPKVVFASTASLEAGFARELFVEWACDSKNLVLFTERGQFGTLARMLQSESPPKVVKLTTSKKIPLSGEELKSYEEDQNRLKREAARKAAKPAEEGNQASPAAGAGGDVAGTNANDSGGGQPLGEGGHAAVLWNVFMDGFKSAGTGIAPMFPFQEYSNEWDEYGEIINADEFVMREEETIDLGTSHTTTTRDGESRMDSEAEDMLLDEKPCKVVSDTISVEIKCGLQYMDFEGRSDGRSIKTILAHVVPLKLVLVHGSAEATEHLRQHSLKHVCPHVFAPMIGQTVDVTSDLSAYKVRLTERLMSNVLFKKLGDYELAWIDGEVGSQEDDILPLLPNSRIPPPHKAVFVGDLKLADFKQLLANKGVQAEFTSGALRCGESIAVRKVGGDGLQKSGNQQVIMEGPLSEEYYRIREYLYSQFYML
eukprot:c25506_g1_i1 orf=216-2441(+)